jgi:hypothetical protein
VSVYMFFISELRYEFPQLFGELGTFVVTGQLQTLLYMNLKQNFMNIRKNSPSYIKISPRHKIQIPGINIFRFDEHLTRRKETYFGLPVLQSVCNK